MTDINVENYAQQGGNHWVIGESGSLTVNGTQTNKSLNFDTTNETAPANVGQMAWNDSDRTIDMKISDSVTVQLGQELLMPRAVNKTGGTLTNGTVVYVDDAQGNRPTIAKADADTYATSYKTIGIVTEDIQDNLEGFVTISGLVRGLDTSAWSEGDCLYLSTTAGELTTTAPADGKMRIFVGMVIVSHVTQGVICVRVQRDKYMFGDIDAGNYSYFESDGTLVFNGNATVWNDINIGGLALTKAASNQPDLITLDSTNILVYGFDGAGTGVEEVHGAFELVHDYKEGTDLQPHLHYYTTTTGAGNVKWHLQYWANYGTTNEVTGTTTVTTATTETAWSQHRVNFDSVIDGTNLDIGTQIHFRLWRDAGDAADTYGADVALGTFGIHYEIDTVGSRQITTK